MRGGSALVAGQRMEGPFRLSTVTHKPLRADARRNREKVVAAASAAFAESGLDAQVEDIARRAGVGVGTLYRHFPTKDALIDAIVDARFAELTGAAERALEEDDVWAGFESFLVAAVELQAGDRARDRADGRRRARSGPPVPRDAPRRAAPGRRDGAARSGPAQSTPTSARAPRRPRPAPQRRIAV